MTPTPGQPNFQTGLFINNEFVDALDGSTFDVFNPYDNTLLAKVSEAKHADVDRAVAAARKAFPAWAAMSPSDRGVLIGKLAEAIEKDRDNLSLIESLDTGHPIRDTRNLDVLRTTATFRYFAGMPDKNEGTVIPVETGFLNYVTRVPVGVVGQVVPWNFPLMFTSWKMGPALAAGNCVVMKQAELTPLSTLRVAELAREVGFPAGVINVIPGYGHIAGQYLAEHMGVDKLSFTGSTMTGRKIVQASAGNLKRIQLELGGKGAGLVLHDADIAKAVGAIQSVWAFHSGQICTAPTRAIVHRSRYDELVAALANVAPNLKVGDPTAMDTLVGPVISAAQRGRIEGYIQAGADEGAEIIVDGRRPAHMERGFYVAPTLIAGCTSTMTPVQEEIFGPVVVVVPFDDEEEAIAIANGTEFGLYDYVFSQDSDRAYKIARQLRSGNVGINSAQRNHEAPFGGFKMSGVGRDGGDFGMLCYTEMQSIIWPG